MTNKVLPICYGPPKLGNTSPKTWHSGVDFEANPQIEFHKSRALKKQNKPDSEENRRQDVQKAKTMSQFLHLPKMKPIKHKYVWQILIWGFPHQNWMSKWRDVGNPEIFEIAWKSWGYAKS